MATECRCPMRDCGLWIPEREYTAHPARMHREPWRRPAEVAERVRGRLRRMPTVTRSTSDGLPSLGKRR